MAIRNLLNGFGSLRKVPLFVVKPLSLCPFLPRVRERHLQARRFAFPAVVAGFTQQPMRVRLNLLQAR